MTIDDINLQNNYSFETDGEGLTPKMDVEGSSF